MKTHYLKKRRKYYYILILPALLFYSLALMGPLVIGTIPSAFYKWNILKGIREFIGFDNFIRLIHDGGFFHTLSFTTILGICTILITNVFAFFIALLLSNKVFGKAVIRACFFIPNIISGIVVALVWSFIFLGVTPVLGEFLHSEVIADFSWFGSQNAAFFAVLIVSVWQGLGFLMILYITGLQTISADVIEAAKIDGCTGLKMITKIQVPLIMPTITINMFISIANAFKAFDIVYALTGGGPFNSTETIALDIYNEAFGNMNMGYGCAKAVVLFLIIAVITLIQLSITRKREVQS